MIKIVVAPLHTNTSTLFILLHSLDSMKERSFQKAGTCECLCWHWLRTLRKSPCVWMQFLHRSCRWSQKKPTTHKRRIHRWTPTERMYKFMWKHIVSAVIITFPCRRLFEFIYAQIKVNASRNRFMIGCGSGGRRITLVKLRSCSNVWKFYFFATPILSSCANRIACESILRQQVNHRRFQCKINTHRCANAYALNGAHRLHKYINLITGWVSSVSFARFGVSADCWVCKCMCALEHQRENDTHKYVTGISIIHFFSRLSTGRVCVERPLK